MSIFILMIKLIADSGATSTKWCLLGKGKPKLLYTQGISPYFFDTQQIASILKSELLPKLKKVKIDKLYYYGTGCANLENASSVNKAIQLVFGKIKIEINHDLTAAAKALCGNTKGIACILGTGSGSCYYNGKKIVKSSTGLGFILGDEGSGAFLGKKVLQHYLYSIFDDSLMAKFNAQFVTTKTEILESIYKKQMPNRYLASFSVFLAANRGHFMIENIIEDGFNEFFYQHLIRYKEIEKIPVHFVGAVSNAFKDVLQELCNSYGFKLGKICKDPMQGLIAFHQE